MNFQTMNKQRKFVLIAAAVGIVSMFLPWLTISLFGYSQSQNGMHDRGILVFICFLVSAAIAYMGDQTTNFDKNLWGIVLAAGAIALIATISFYMKASNSIMGSSVVGYGLYIAALASIGILISAYVFRSPTDNLKDSFNSMKKNIESKINTEPTSKTNPTNSTTETKVSDNNPKSTDNTNIPV